MDKFEISTFLDFSKAYDKSKPLFIDTEGEPGAYRIKVLQVYQTDWPQVLILLNDFEKFYNEVRTNKIVGHNFIYDLYCFKNEVKDFQPPTNWSDTFYLARITKPEWQKYSLDKCLTNVIGYDPYDKEGLDKKKFQISFTGDPKYISDEQFLYAAIDVFELPKLYDQVKVSEDHFVYKQDITTAELCLKMSELGMPIDYTELDKLELETKETLDLVTKELPAGLNVNSYKQVRALLGLTQVSDVTALSWVGLAPTGVEGVKMYAAGKGELLETDYVHSEVKANQALNILKKRKLLKILNFISRARIASKDTGRVKAHFSPHAISGRVQAQDENLSQYPRTLKRMWGLQPNQSTVLLYTDYSQLELRSICAILPENNMEKAFRLGKDLHSYTAELLDLGDITLPPGVSARFIAKQLNFLSLYGGGKRNFQNMLCEMGVFLPMELVNSAVDSWKSIYSGITDWHNRNGKSITKMDETISGRPYKASKYTDLNNIRNQGTGAEVAKLALEYCYHQAKLEDYGVRIVNFVHDAIVAEMPNNKDLFEPVSKLVACCFQKAWFDIMQRAPIKDLPMPVSIQIGYNWQDLEEEQGIYNYELDPTYMYTQALEAELKKIKETL